MSAHDFSFFVFRVFDVIANWAQVGYFFCSWPPPRLEKKNGNWEKHPDLLGKKTLNTSEMSFEHTLDQQRRVRCGGGFAAADVDAGDIGDHDYDDDVDSDW